MDEWRIDEYEVRPPDLAALRREADMCMGAQVHARIDPAALLYLLERAERLRAERDAAIVSLAEVRHALASVEGRIGPFAMRLLSQSIEERGRLLLAVIHAAIKEAEAYDRFRNATIKTFADTAREATLAECDRSDAVAALRKANGDV